MTTLRTALSWLQAHGLSDDAECWVLGSNTVQPVTGVTSEGADMVLHTAPAWSEPTPAPLRYASVCDTLLENYSGGGTLRWRTRPTDPYRGSYVVDTNSAVFFLFLPQGVELVESHDEKMAQRKQQAIQLTREIQETETPWLQSPRQA